MRQRRPTPLAYALGYQFGRLILPLLFLWLLVESCSSAGRLLTVAGAEQEATDCLTVASAAWAAEVVVDNPKTGTSEILEMLHLAGWALVTGRFEQLERNPVEGAKCLLVAAEWDRGHAPSQRLLGAMYGSGIGVPQDWVMAYYWLSLAVMQGENHDIGGVSAVSMLAQIADEELTAHQLEEARRRIRDWHDRQLQP